jgi:hypothetical protein
MRDEASIVHVFNFQTNIQKSLMCLRACVIGSTSIGLGHLDLLQFGLGHLDLLQFGLVTIWTSVMLFPYVATVCNAISLSCYRL